MQETLIEAEPRTDTGSRSCRRLRQRGMIPGVVYGHGEECLNIVMDGHALLQVLHTGAQVFELKVKGKPGERVLVKGVQYDALGDDIVHMDFQRVSLTDMVDVTVPIVLVGTAAGAVHKGIVNQTLKELHVACTPDRIPEEIRVQITHLDIGMMLTVKEVELSEGLTTTNAPGQVVVMVHPPVAEAVIEAEEEAAEEEAAEPEIIGGAPETGEEAEPAEQPPRG